MNLDEGFEHRQNVNFDATFGHHYFQSALDLGVRADFYSGCYAARPPNATILAEAIRLYRAAIADTEAAQKQLETDDDYHRHWRMEIFYAMTYMTQKKEIWLERIGDLSSKAAKKRRT